MLLKKIVIENVRSFLDRREMSFDGPISIIVGPNGGGKTNLLDVLNTMLRRYLFATPYFVQTEGPEDQLLWDVRQNDQLQQMRMEKHSHGKTRDQYVSIEIEVSESDLANMRTIRDDAGILFAESRRRFARNHWEVTTNWEIEKISIGSRFAYEWRNGSLIDPSDISAAQFMQYLRLYELDNDVRAEMGRASLRLSMIYLPVNRAASGFQSKVSLAGYNDVEQKRSLDATTSRSNANIISLAVGRLAQKFRLLQEDDNVGAKSQFYSDPNLTSLSKSLKDLGYDWELTTVEPRNNTYDITLRKQGSSFLAGAASSGERELFTYLFVIYALNVRDALIIVDEPELHLHPRWQKSLFNLFEELSQLTGNQFVLATHSPTFISPASIQYVSRVYIHEQKSNIRRLNAGDLPELKHLFNVVNSHNNERIFFTDKVVLVEGLSDRIFFEKVLDLVAKKNGILRDSSLEIVSVSGKGLFSAYKKVLDACGVPSSIIADLDFIEQIGTPEIKSLFRTNVAEIKQDVLENVKSLDGDALVRRIDEAMSTGSWQDAQEIWEYIKSCRRQILPRLSCVQQQQLTHFIETQAAAGTFLLRKGALEDYLPIGNKSKDMNKLIGFVESSDFWERLPTPERDEIERIAEDLLGVRST